MEEELQDVAADTNAEVEETTNSNETVETNEDTVNLQEKLEQAERAKSQILARAKKAEEELKALKAKPQNNNNDPQLSEELKLIARGLSDEEIEQAKVVAKGKGIALTEAVKDPLFQIFQSNLKEKERKEKAKLGASKGSGETREENEVKSGMAREEHLKVFQKKVGR